MKKRRGRQPPQREPFFLSELLSPLLSISLPLSPRHRFLEGCVSRGGQPSTPGPDASQTQNSASRQTPPRRLGRVVGPGRSEMELFLSTTWESPPPRTPPHIPIPLLTVYSAALSLCQHCACIEELLYCCTFWLCVFSFSGISTGPALQSLKPPRPALNHSQGKDCSVSGVPLMSLSSLHRYLTHWTYAQHKYYRNKTIIGLYRVK